MNLVSLGLERGRTAREALEAMTPLIEKYGQWGSGIAGYTDSDGSFDNSYIIGDGTEAWILEAAGHQWVAKRVTKGVANIGNYPGIVAAPAVSPDGNKIACTMTKDGNSEIYVIDTKGRIIKRLTWHQAIDTAPTWSPDGRMIAFSSDRTGAPQIYLMDSDGLNTRRLTYEGRYNDSPIWSSRGVL